MPEDNATASGTTEVMLEAGKRQYLLAPRRGSSALAAGVRPMSAGAMRGVVTQIPGLDVVRTIRPRRALSPMSVTVDESTEVYVARIETDRAELIRQTAPPQLIVEEDAYLDYGGPLGLLRQPPRFGAISFGALAKPATIKFRVLGEGDKPLANVKVSLTGEAFPAEGQTDKKGEVALEMVTLPGRPPRSLFVTAPINHWDRYLTEPNVSDSAVNVIRLDSFKETVSGFPDEFRYGWGQKEMGLDRMPEGVNGKGVKVAIIDSGADNTHQLLRHIKKGADFTNDGDPKSWAKDIIGHGSHCAGVIAARSDEQTMLRGFVPEAEIHVLKVFPGGQFSSLLDALDYCIEQGIDVANMSLGSPQPSETVEQKLEEAVLAGVACIVAAGNSGGPVQYPALSPKALAVAAVGKLNEYRPNSWDSTSVQPTLVSADGIFAPAFSCFGPEIAVCAPGVAIISTVPGGFEPQSGTSMAAPHVTGLAALLIGHHPLFRSELSQRSQQRVAGLFNIIRSMCAPYQFGFGRTGSGLPRLHGLEAILQPVQGEQLTTPAAADGRAQQPQPVMTPLSAFGGAIGGVMPGGFAPLGAGGQFAPQAAMPGQGGMGATPTLYDPRLLAALYAQGLSPQSRMPYFADPRLAWLYSQGQWPR